MMLESQRHLLWRLAAAWVGPLCCWAVLALIVIAYNWADEHQLVLHGLLALLTILAVLVHIPLASMFCGFCTAYFYSGVEVLSRKQPGYGTTYLLIVPLIPTICLFIALLSVHQFLFHTAFEWGMNFWGPRRARE